MKLKNYIRNIIKAGKTHCNIPEGTNPEQKLQINTYIRMSKIYVMQSKLTLSIKSEIIEQAKVYARNRGRSLSNIVEEYFKSLEGKSFRNNGTPFNSLVEELAGSVRYNSKKSDEELLKEVLTKKHV